jgi:hypothetical protein
VWKITIILKSGSPPIAFAHPTIVPRDISEAIQKAKELGGDVVFKGATDTGGNVEIHLAVGQIEGWIAIEQLSGRVARPDTRIRIP